MDWARLLEFLCAQAPCSLQGLLIGLWYAMFSIRYLIMRSVDYVITSPDGILVCQVVRTSLVLLSLVMYVYVSRGYQYRIRNWVVNVQWMVEDVFERRMDQEERYIKEQCKRLMVGYCSIIYRQVQMSQTIYFTE